MFIEDFYRNKRTAKEKLSKVRLDLPLLHGPWNALHDMVDVSPSRWNRQYVAGNKRRDHGFQVIDVPKWRNTNEKWKLLITLLVITSRDEWRVGHESAVGSAERNSGTGSLCFACPRQHHHPTPHAIFWPWCSDQCIQRTAKNVLYSHIAPTPDLKRHAMKNPRAASDTSSHIQAPKNRSISLIPSYLPFSKSTFCTKLAPWHVGDPSTPLHLHILVIILNVDHLTSSLTHTHVQGNNTYGEQINTQELPRLSPFINLLVLSPFKPIDNASHARHDMLP